MNALSDFQKDYTNEMGELRGFLVKPSTKLALVFAISSMAESGFGKDELRGATELIRTLEKMSRPPQDMPTFPDKSSLQSYENLEAALAKSRETTT